MIIIVFHRFYDSQGKAIIISELRDVGAAQKAATMKKEIENNGKPLSEDGKSLKEFLSRKKKNAQRTKINLIVMEALEGKRMWGGSESCVTRNLWEV